MSRKTRSLLASAAATAVALAVAPQALHAQTIDGSVPMTAPASGISTEYGPALALQGTGTGFGNNQSELDGAYGKYAVGGNLNLAITGNLENNSNGFVIFLDAHAGGAIANTAGGGFNQFGSVGGRYSDDWGTDTNGGPDVTPTPGGGSIVHASFNPEKAIEVEYVGANSAYYTHIIDLTVPNSDTSLNRDIYLGQNTPGAGPQTQFYNRDPGATFAGSVTHAFDDSNTAGVNNLGDPAGDPKTATTGFEYQFDSMFVDRTPGKAVRVLAFITSGGGDYLSNQLLPGMHYADANNPGNPGGFEGNPLIDVRTDAFDKDMFITLFEPTFTAGADNKWSTAANWAGNFAPNGIEHDAAFVGGAGSVSLDLDATVGYLKFNGSGGYTISAPGAQTLTINAGSAAGRIDVAAFSNVINPKLIIASDTRINLGVAGVTLNAVDNSAGKFITIAGAGTVNLNGPQTNGAGASIVVDSGTLNVNSDGGSAASRTQSIYVSGTANLNVSQHLANIGVNPGGLATLAPNGGTHIIVADNLFQGSQGKLSIGDGKLLLKVTPAGTWNGAAYTDVTGLVASGRGTSNLWDGQGIITSQSNAVGSNYNSIGVAKASDVRPSTATATATWAGETITGSDTLVMYTYGGDATLDGKINIDDYVKIDSGIAAGLTGWVNGDFNYDGKVSIDDYITVIDANIGNQAGVFPTGGGVESGGGGSGVTAVPEPASVSLLALGAIGALRRKRRRDG